MPLYRAAGPPSFTMAEATPNMLSLWQGMPHTSCPTCAVEGQTVKTTLGQVLHKNYNYNEKQALLNDSDGGNFQINFNTRRSVWMPSCERRAATLMLRRE